jgi:ubiquinone/menaquinone biosynthesis C-methylase UbiE
MTEEITYNAIDFSSQYFLLRKKEGRIYSDEEVSSLPEINKQHRYYNEWEIRKRSSIHLKKYLSDKKKPLRILEIGCGNGWLSAKLSEIPLSHITGIDINAEELSQARRVFNKIDNLDFFNCSLQDEAISDHQFDIIVFAASMQYFSSLKNIMNDSIRHLKPGGEVHILDTLFYEPKELNAARRRSKDYFSAIGFPEMAEHYFHHSLDELRSFNYRILYDPNSIINRFKKNRNPFYWFCVKVNA